MRVRKFDIENGGFQDWIEKPLTDRDILQIPTGEYVLSLGDANGFRYSLCLTRPEIDLFLTNLSALNAQNQPD